MSNAYAPTPNGKAMVGDDVGQILNGITGVTPRVHHFKNDDARFAFTAESTSAADNGPIAVFLGSDGLPRLTITDDGVDFAQSALTNLSLPGTLSVTGATGLTGAVTLAGTLALPGPTHSVVGNGFSIIENVTGTPAYGLQRIYTPEQFGAVRDGNLTDDGQALQDCLDAARKNHGVMQLSSGRYRCDRVLRCNGANGVVIRGSWVGSSNDQSQGAGRPTIRFTSAIGGGTLTRNHLMEFVGSTDIVLEGFNIEGDASTVADPHNLAGPTNGTISTCIFIAPNLDIHSEGGGHVVMRGVNCSGGVATAAVYIWSRFYVTIENCKFFTNGEVSNNAALALTGTNYAKLFSTDMAVTGGSTSTADPGGTYTTNALLYAGTYIDGMRQVSVRQSLISNQSGHQTHGPGVDLSPWAFSTTNNYGIYLDSVRDITIQDSEPTTSNSSPSIIIKDLSPANRTSEGITIDHCGMGSGPQTTVAAVSLESGGIIHDLRVTGCYSGNLQGPIVAATVDLGGGFRRLVVSGYLGAGATTPSHAVKVASSANTNVLADSEIHCVVRVALADVHVPVDVGAGAIGGSTKIYGASAITASGGCRAELTA